MPNTISTMATDIINQSDDKKIPGMALGSSGPIAEVTQLGSGNKPTLSTYPDDADQDYYKPQENSKKPNGAYDPEDYTEYEDYGEGFPESRPITEEGNKTEETKTEETDKEDKDKENKDPDTTEEETNKNEGWYEQRDYEIGQEMENLLGAYELLMKDGYSKWAHDRYISNDEFKTITGMDKADYYSKAGWDLSLGRQYGPMLKQKALENISNKLSALRTERNEIYKKWDRRTDEQKREDELRYESWKRDDTAYQRAKEDLIAAGYNPAFLKGVNYGGGGGTSGGSKAEDEEEKRRRRRREQKEKEREMNQMAMQLVKMLGIGAMMRGK